MIAGYYGYETSLPSLRSRFSISLKGATLARILEVGQFLGLQPRPLRLELDELHQLKMPCILHWSLNHFVVLKSAAQSRLTLIDPAVGERSLTFSEASLEFTGIAVELTPGPEFREQKQSPPPALSALMGRVVGLPSALFQVLGLALVLELFALLAPQFVQIVTDQVLANGDRDLLTLLGIGFLLLTIVQVGISTLRSWSVTVLGANLNLNWTNGVFGHLLTLPEDYFQKRHLGDIVSRFGAIDVIQQTLTTRFVEVILDGLMACFTLVMLLVYSPALSLVTMGAFAAYATIRALSYRRLRDANMNQILASAKQQSQFFEAIRGARAIRLCNGGPSQASRYANRSVETLNRRVITSRLGLLFGSLNSLLFGVQRILMFWIGARMTMNGEFTVGMLLAFSSYSDQFTARATALIDYAVEFRMLRLQGERLADIVFEQPEKHVEGRHRGPPPEPSIELRNVSFRYSPGDPWILKDCNVLVRPGESIAITGPSGCGKTTLVKLLLGLLEPEEGTILVGGIELTLLGKQAYREMVGSVMQDDQLFAGTIADNISFFTADASAGSIESAAALAEVHDEIVRAPMGYQALVGDMGSSLSGGQKQRILLARALYRQPRILILDEATSHLDVSRERLINDRIHRMKSTRIIAAHRPETIASAHRVVAIERGQLLEVTAAA